MLRRTISAICLLAIPAVLSAQRRRPSAHLDLGGGPSGGGDYSNTGGLLGRIGGSLPLGPDIDLAAEASIFGSLVSTGCLDFCKPSFPVVKSAVASLVFPITSVYDYHKMTVMMGGGPFRFDSGGMRRFTRFGAEVGIEMVLARQVHATYTLGARADLITATPRGHIWLLPITAGLRF